MDNSSLKKEIEELIWDSIYKNTIFSFSLKIVLIVSIILNRIR
jgi:hypothetical protein